MKIDYKKPKRHERRLRKAKSISNTRSIRFVM